ncbi:hypothetical protein ACCC92_03145 [Mucilaginibacter sp. Mucisp84]|uniref:hypothetical protein n=1 Tax=Mucilaginibacter sp. Mucisp84 TaxID=3243058 RepID=UPI0039A6FB30
MDNTDYLIDQIQGEINDKKKFERLDFIKSQWLTWGAIVVGFGASIAAALGAPSGVTAVFGCFSALFVTIEKSINFSKRSSWNGYYKVKLEALLFKLKEKPKKRLVFNKDFNTLRTEWLKTFPGSTSMHGK